MTSCLFCNIVSQQVPGRLVYEDDRVLAFEDINPQAPIHILVIPKKHFHTALEITSLEAELIGHIFIVINKIAGEKGVADSGFRVVLNCGRGGGQTVYHLHFHLLGGRQMRWPPG